MRVLVVEDEPDLASALRAGLVPHGFAVDLAPDLETAAGLAAAFPYDAMVLDRMLPGGDGAGLCAALRSRGYRGGILMLTARDALVDKVEGLNAGADDYLVKPFAFPELIARLHAVARRHQPIRTPVLRARDVVVRLDEGTVERGGVAIALSRKEYMLLVHFLRHPGRLVTHEQMLEVGWDAESETSADTIRVHVKNLRKKLGDGGPDPLLRTVHGQGYRLES